MLITADSHDAFHPWPEGRGDWVEAVWFGTWVPERAMTIYVYHTFRPALGIYGGGCIIWDSQSNLPWDAPLYQFDVCRPIPGRIDLRNLQLDNGARITSLLEGHEFEVEFRNARAHLCLKFTATTPPDLTERDGTPEFFAGHLDQPGKYEGFVEIEGQRHVIDAFGIRDRSWGPRKIGDDIRMGYAHGAAPDVAFLAFSRPAGAREEIFKGYLSLDGERVPVASGHREIEREGLKLKRIRFALTDKSGRTLEGNGTPLNQFSYMSYPNMLSHHYLMRWELPAGIVYGEEQDLWSLPLWRDHIRETQ
jgi:hypothetical protein